VPISNEYKCIFIHIPKACGTSIEYVLNMIDDQTDVNFENRDAMYGWVARSSTDLLDYGFLSPVLQHLTVRDLKKILPIDIFNQYFKFAFVRNPWGRLVSAYHFEKKAFPEYENLSFIQFLSNLSPFWKQEQCFFIVDENGEKNVDFVGRFEYINKDFKKLCKKMKISTLKLPLKNKIPHEHYSQYYTDETREMVADLFQNDIRMFGYKFKKANLIEEVKKKLNRYIIKRIDRQSHKYERINHRRCKRIYPMYDLRIIGTDHFS
jgi:hypothetical protein